MKTSSPKWLSTTAKRIFQKIVKSLPEIDEQQIHVVALLSDNLDTYVSATTELQEYASKMGTLTVTGSAGQAMPHPSFRIQKQCFDSYCKLFSQLRASLGQCPTPESSSLDDLVSEVESIMGN